MRTDYINTATSSIRNQLPSFSKLGNAPFAFFLKGTTPLDDESTLLSLAEAAMTTEYLTTYS